MISRIAPQFGLIIRHGQEPSEIDDTTAAYIQKRYGIDQAAWDRRLVFDWHGEITTLVDSPFDPVVTRLQEAIADLIQPLNGYDKTEQRLLEGINQSIRTGQNTLNLMDFIRTLQSMLPLPVFRNIRLAIARVIDRHSTEEPRSVVDLQTMRKAERPGKVLMTTA